MQKINHIHKYAALKDNKKPLECKYCTCGKFYTE